MNLCLYLPECVKILIYANSANGLESVFYVISQTLLGSMIIVHILEFLWSLFSHFWKPQAHL